MHVSARVKALVVVAIFIVTVFVSFVGAQGTTGDISVGYWVWGGVRIEKAHTEADLYLFQGRFHKKNGRVHFKHLGLYPHKLEAKKLYLVFRFDDLVLDEGVVNTLVRNMNMWKMRGVNVVGVQLDFDSATSKLVLYSEELKKLRTKIGGDYKVSITGLADWVVSSAPGDVVKLAESVDEIIFQLYEGTKPVTNEEDFVEKLAKANFDFKVGLLSDNDIHKEKYAGILSSARFRGVVYFVLKKSEGANV